MAKKQMWEIIDDANDRLWVIVARSAEEARGKLLLSLDGMTPEQCDIHMEELCISSMGNVLEVVANMGTKLDMWR